MPKRKARKKIKKDRIYQEWKKRALASRTRRGKGRGGGTGTRMVAP